MKNIWVRAISGAVYVALIIASVIFTKLGFSFLLLFFNIVAVFEFTKFKEHNPGEVIRMMILAGLVFVFHSVSINGWVNPNLLWLFVLVPIGLSIRALFTNPKQPGTNITCGVFALLYITMPLILLNQINMTTGDNFSWLVLIVLILIWVNDTFAYLVGIAIGKHKIFPRVSPKKSWEGFFGGIVFTGIAAWFFYPLVDFENRIIWVTLGILVAIAAVMGDFVESMLKREAGVKDSGKIIPGHGGMLDRIDSLLFVFPIVFVFLKLSV